MKVVHITAGLSLSLAAFAVSPATAASPITEAFLANVRPNAEFVEKSSRIAIERSSNAQVRDYAQGAMTEAIKVASDIPARSVKVASHGSGDANALLTGRSVSIDGPTGGAGQAANGRAPLGPADLDALGKMSDRKFIDAFWLEQVDALSQLRADYQAYVDDGDDAALVALAQRSLPEVERRLALLSKI